MILMQRPQWWDGALWFRTYTPGGYDGYKTLGGRRLPGATLADAKRNPGHRLRYRFLAVRHKPPVVLNIRAESRDLQRGIRRTQRKLRRLAAKAGR